MKLIFTNFELFCLIINIWYIQNNFASEYNNFKHVLEITNMHIFLFEAFSSQLPLQWALSLLMLCHQQKHAPQCSSNQ